MLIQRQKYLHFHEDTIPSSFMLFFLKEGWILYIVSHTRIFPYDISSILTHTRFYRKILSSYLITNRSKTCSQSIQ